MLIQCLLIEIHQNTIFFLMKFLCLLSSPTKKDFILNTRRKKGKMRADITQSKNLDLWSSTLKMFFKNMKHVN